MLTSPISILMPVYNEADIIEDVIEEWVKEVLLKLPTGSELILDDSSTDETTNILKKLSHKYPFIKLNLSKRDGFFNSALRLYKLAKCDLIFFTDSDGQYPPKDFWEIAKHIDHYDMVHGFKNHRKDPFYRVFCSSIYNFLVRIFFNIPDASDVNSAFRLIKRPLIDAVLDQIRHLKMLPNSEMYIRAAKLKYQIKNVPVDHRHRKFGKSRSLPAFSFYVEGFKTFIRLLILKKELYGKNYR